MVQDLGPGVDYLRMDSDHVNGLDPLAAQIHPGEL